MVGIPVGASGDGRSICSISQGAFATAHPDSLPGMDDAELLLWRIERLQAAIDHLDDGNLNAFGKRMGWADGSYVGQMLRGARAISEKFIRRFEYATKLDGWFDPDLQHGDDLEHKIRAELIQKDIPEHVLQTLLDLVRNCPPKKRVA